MGECSPLQEAFGNLYGSLRKQFGAIPSEIQNELNALDAIINPLDSEPLTPSEPEAA